MAGELQRMVRVSDGLTQEQRIARAVANAEDVPEPQPGVTRLNEGFFTIERMRAGPVVKARGK